MNLTGNTFVMNTIDRSLRSLYILMASCILLTAGILTACEKGIFSTDYTTVKEYNLPPFGDINVNGIFEIELKNDTLYSLRMEGNGRLLDNISFFMDGDTLKLADDNSFKWLPDYPPARLIISFPDIRGIRLNSPSAVRTPDTLTLSRLSITSAGLTAEMDLTVDITNLFFTTSYDDFGYYILRGKSDNADIRIFGTAQLEAGGLRINNAWIRNYSTHDCRVRAENRLRVWLGHYGNIYYSGSPEEIIIELMDSRGRLIPIYPE